MPREIFGEVSNPSVKLGSQAWYTVPLSILVHAALLAVLVVVPLVATGALPSVPTTIMLTTDAKLPDPPPPPRAPEPIQRSKVPTTVNDPRIAPLNAPETIQPETETPRVVGPAVEGGINLPGGTGLPIGTGVNIGPTPPPAPAVPQAPLRPGGDIKVPRKVHHVAPVYPAIAQQARVEGTVIIEATIGVDGRVKDARVLSSKPLLDQAAIDAVMQWRFTPTLLNGVPVPVLMTVTVTFTLR
jgi:protein TonB